ncbi:ABC transporter ATP-binding protein [Terricaulis sp.]|uniref:ABC transporter ATP-binding protein n=1 Tax=Terricaulis sp. TaxID=2768686 RepID=UPI0037852677
MSALLSLDGVGVTLGGRAALTGISLKLTATQVVALLGPNGAGKTTLMRAALGILQASAGGVRLGGDDPRVLSTRARALRAAYLPQRPHAIWPVRVEDMVALGRFAHGAAPDRLAPPDRAAVDAALAACALEPLRRRRMDEISGGEKARAHLARALAQHAPLLVLDEPTAGLDPAQALAVADIMRAHAGGGGAVLMSTHDIALAARCADHVLLLNDGAAISAGAPEEALDPASITKAYGRSGRLERLSDGAFVAAFE